MVYGHDTCSVLLLIHCHLMSDFKFSPQDLIDTILQPVSHDFTLLLKKRRAKVAEVSGIDLLQFI